MRVKRICASLSLSEDVGSSMMTMREGWHSALAISTSWRWASDSSATCALGSRSMPSRASSAAASRRSARRSTQPARCGRRAANRLSATLRLGARLSSW